MQQLHFAQHQSQIVSQTQIQFLHMLTMCNQELNSWLEEQYNENPLLDINSPVNTQNELSDFSSIRSTQYSDLDTFSEPAVYEGLDLYHYLTEQLRYQDYSQQEWNTIAYLITRLDHRGFFCYDLNQISVETGINRMTLEKCLNSLKELEPYGIFSPNIQQCYLKQLEKREIYDSLLETLISENLEDLLYKKIGKLQKQYRVSRTAIETYHQLLSVLSPYPLFGFPTFDSPACIIPDIVCRMEQGILVPYLNEHTTRFYGISSIYQNLMQTTENKELKSYLQSRWSAAKQIIMNIENRKQTLLKITRSILKKQSGFFLQNEFLVPMSMKEIAQDCNLSISTISRAVHDKYLESPHRIIAMRKLFTASAEYSKRTRYALSPTEIKHILREIIASENPKNPFQDEELAIRLQEQAIYISRRTVSKYRKELCIPTSRERKER